MKSIPAPKRLHLYPCCKIVTGAKKDAIYDLQRERHYLIPKGLTTVVDELKTATIEAVINRHIHVKGIIMEYISFLINNELAYASVENDIDFSDIGEFGSVPSIITNAIIDRDETSSYDLELVFQKLDSVLCENIEIRWFTSLSRMDFDHVLSLLSSSRIRDVELLWKYDAQWNLDTILYLYQTYPRMKKVTIYGTPDSLCRTYIHEEITVIYTNQEDINENCCGVVNSWYMLPKLELYLESLAYNSCLNRKVGIDCRGLVKNCPSMSTAYGHIHDTDLKALTASDKFRTIWNVKKDDIEVCKDCELRHMCQDCRAFTCNPNNPFSKPSKCKYNPYEE